MRTYSSHEICRLSGITYRQLDHWTRHGLFTPSAIDAHGSGTQRRWSRVDLRALCVARRLLDVGAALRALDGLQKALHVWDLDAELYLLHHEQTWYTLKDEMHLGEALRRFGAATVVLVTP